MTNILILGIILIMGAQFGVALTSSIIVHPILKKRNKHGLIEPKNHGTWLRLDYGSSEDGQSGIYFGVNAAF